MAFWGNNKWMEVNEAQEKPIVSGFSSNSLKEGSYKLTVGTEAIVSSGLTDKKGSLLKIEKYKMAHIEPGQFAYLITDEDVNIPMASIGFINIATEFKLHGLCNVSGFHVDPGYSGKLIFSVFNAGPASIPIYGGKPLFRLWLSDFEGPSQAPLTSYDKIPREWAGRLHGTYSSPFALAARISKLENDIARLTGSKIQSIAVFVFAGLFVFPFVAAFYANVFSMPFADHINEYIRGASTKIFGGTDPQAQAAKSTPAANTPSTAATPAH